MRPATAALPSGFGATRPPPVSAGAQPSTPLRLLTWTFTLFNSARVLSYLPTIWAIHASGQSDQYSIWTWMIWLGSNTTMALWLYEQAGRRFNRVIAVNVCNAAMCLATLAVIVAYRL